MACKREGGGRELAEFSLIVVEPPESLPPFTNDSREFPPIDMFFIMESLKEELFLISIPFMRDSLELEVDAEDEPGTEGVADLNEGLRKVLGGGSSFNLPYSPKRRGVGSIGLDGDPRFESPDGIS